MITEYKNITGKVATSDFSKYGITTDDLRNSDLVVSKILAKHYGTNYVFEKYNYSYSSTEGINFSGTLEHRLTLQ